MSFGSSKKSFTMRNGLIQEQGSTSDKQNFFPKASSGFDFDLPPPPWTGTSVCRTNFPLPMSKRLDVNFCIYVIIRLCASM